MSMPIKEAIKRIRNHMDVHRIGQYPHVLIGEAFNMAIAALKEKEEREDPRPLTYKELLEMHGEPVFVTVPGKPHRSKWCIVDLLSLQPGLLGKEYFCNIVVAGTDAVKVYRHKPKMDQEPKIEVMDKYYVVTKYDCESPVVSYGYKRIADRYGVSESDLLKVNGLSWDTPLYPGQHLWIPKPKET